MNKITVNFNTCSPSPGFEATPAEEMDFDEPIPGGKGLVCAKIGNKNYPVGELKLKITNHG